MESYLVVNNENTCSLTTTNRCFLDVNAFSTAAYWSFILYNIVNRSALLCKLLSMNSRLVVYLNNELFLNNCCHFK